MVAPVPASARPEVSVIVPARNEESSLGACLASLVLQPEPDFEIIVVDDGSTDHTRAIAQSLPQVKVVEPGPLPDRYTGKNNALIAGVKAARGQWLLFTDADTVHRPDSLSRSLAEAKQRGVDLLSYSPEQEVRSIPEKAVMPVIFSELAAAYPPAEVSRPDSDAAAANGQFILVRRDAYDAVGGHAAVAGQILEDVALARRFKQSGRRIFFRYGGDILRTRMYRTYTQLRDGWTKNLALLFPSPARLALARLQEFVILVAGLAFAAIAFGEGHIELAVVSLVLSAALYALLVRRISRAHFSWTSNALAIVGLPLFAYLLLRSKIAHRSGKVSWSGRSYPAGCAGDRAPEEKPVRAT